LSPRRRPERVVEFSWERRRRWFAWLSMRHARGLATAAAGLFAVSGAVSLSDHARRVHATRASIVSVQRATEAFRADHARCPSGVAELVRPPEGPRGPSHYLAQARLDGWGRDFLFTCPGGKFPASADVVSGGPEGSFGLDRVE
jgi:hypothetical protein